MVSNKKIVKQLRVSNRLVFISSIVAIVSALISLMLLFNVDLGSITGGFYYNSIDVTNKTTVYMSKTHVDILNTRYTSESSEFLYCLYGYSENSSFFIQDMRSTKIYSHNETRIEYESCSRDKGYLGTLHSHPQPDHIGYRATCELSSTDIYTFGSDQSPLTGVMCGRNQIAFYTPQNFDESLTVKVVVTEGDNEIN